MALQEVELSERPLKTLRFLTLNVRSINGDNWQKRRETLLYLMRMDKLDVVFLQETHHHGHQHDAGDGTMPPLYADEFDRCEYEGVAGSPPLSAGFALVCRDAYACVTLVYVAEQSKSGT